MYIDATRFVEFLAVLTFFVLLAASLYMLINFYVCDNHACKAYDDAEKKGVPGSKSYTVALLNQTFNDGIWCLPYIGASISTPLALWFMGTPINIKNFAILFFITFATTYFIMAFMGHHYIRVIANTAAEYIVDNCPATP
jgi:hypothetical protein